MLDMALKDRLDWAMTEKGVDASWVIENSGASKATVYLWLDGTTETMGGKYLFKVADLLGVNPKWLGEGKGPRRNESEGKFSAPTGPTDPDPMTLLAQVMHQQTKLLGKLNERLDKLDERIEQIALVPTAVQHLAVPVPDQPALPDDAFHVENGAPKSSKDID